MAQLSQFELIQLSDLNLAECIREHARWNERGIIEERDGTLRTLGASSFPGGLFNTVICTGQTPTDPFAWVDEQQEFYGHQQRGFSLYTRGARDLALIEACLDAGMVQASVPPGMAVMAPLATPPRDPRVSIEVIGNASSLARWVDVQANAYVSLGLPASVAQETMQSPERMLTPSTCWMLVRYDGAPAGGAMALFSHGIAGLFWIGVRPELRNVGLGETVTRAITNHAFERGAAAVVLQASNMGLPVYQRLGFEEITRYPWFMANRSRSIAPPAAI